MITKFIKALTLDRPHSKSYLYNHLKGTHDILVRLGQPEYVCLAGLFHSVYGTCFFDGNLNTDRDRIRDIIGIEAEELVFRFCDIEDRTNFLVHTDETSDIIRDLLVIEYANLLEQEPRIPHKTTQLPSVIYVLDTKYGVDVGSEYWTKKLFDI